MKEVEMTKIVINPEGLAPPIGPYSSAVVKGNFIFVSGTVGRDKEGKIVGKNDVGLQTEKTFQNIKSLLEQAGSKMDDIVKVTIFLKDSKDYEEMNRVRAEFFPRDAPASSAVAIKDFMLPGLLVEIEAIAIKD
jgi:2-iminobutanoate/2-iminopropanoate deaminase